MSPSAYSVDRIEFASAFLCVPRALCVLPPSDVQQSRMSRVPPASGTRPHPHAAKFAHAQQLLEEGKAAQARAVLQPLIARLPTDASVHMLMRHVLSRLGEHQQALYYAERAASLDPGNIQALNLVGNSLVDLGRFDQAAEVLAKAVALDPSQVLNHAALANALGRSGRYVEAEAEARKAVELHPDHPRACGILASILLHTGRADEALNQLRNMVLNDPGDINAFSMMCGAYNYAADAPVRDLVACHFAFGSKLAEMLPVSKEPHPLSRDPDRLLRIAVLAPDFRSHASMFFFEPLADNLDRERFALTVCHTSPIEDTVTRRLKSRPDIRWVAAAGLSPAALAQKLRDEKIDIAIDMAGHTVGNSLAALHLRPAPVQFSWLAYPCTTGVRAIDYRLVDSNTDPDGFEKLGSEKLWRLDPCFFAYRPPVPAEQLPAIVDPPSLANGFVTLGSFSSMPKLNDALLRRWSRVMRALPGSRLIIKNSALTRPETRDWLKRRMELNGLPGTGDRLIIEGPAPSAAALLEHYNRVDISLDTFPYTGMTTVAESLLMGVPLATQTGQIPAGRGAVPYLANLGLKDLITADEDDCIAVTVKLAHDQARRAELRRQLRPRLLSSVIADERGWCRRFETALRQMWRTWCDGQTV